MRNESDEERTPKGHDFMVQAFRNLKTRKKREEPVPGTERPLTDKEVLKLGISIYEEGYGK